MGDKGYTYVLDWIPGQDKLLAYLDGYVEIVDIYSGKRERILKLNEREVNGYQPLCISPDGSKVILKENDDVIIFDLRKRINTTTLAQAVQEDDLDLCLDLGEGQTRPRSFFTA